MKYAFIEAHRGQHRIATMCRVLDVSSSGYYAWRRRGPGRRELADRKLLRAIQDVHHKSRGRYGARRIRAELKALGHRCSRKWVARLMAEHGIEARRRRRYRITTQSKHNKTVAPNVLNREFKAGAPNQKWVADITYIPTAEGWLYLAETSLLGLIDSYGIELVHPRREGRSPKQIGRKGSSNRRWIVGGKLCLLLNHLGLIVEWACDTANVYDGSAFQALVDQVAGQMVVFSDVHFEKQDWQPSNLRLCKRGEWNSRMLIETVLSMLTVVCHLKKVMHRVWAYFQSRLAYTVAIFNLLVQWHGLQPDQNGFVSLSIAEFSL